MVVELSQLQSHQCAHQERIHVLGEDAASSLQDSDLVDESESDLGTVEDLDGDEVADEEDDGWLVDKDCELGEIFGEFSAFNLLPLSMQQL